MSLRSPPAFLSLAFFAALLVLGIVIHRDYGCSVDEDVQRETGAVTVHHVIERLPAALRPPATLPVRFAGFPATPIPLDQYYDKDYGVAFEAPAVALEIMFGLTDTRDIFLFRHLLIFLVSLGGAYAVYSLALRRFADRRIALLAVALLVLTPRLFADSFYNSKDAVFLAAFAIALNTAIAFVLHPRPWSAVLHALATAFAIDVRVAGIVLVAATIALLVARTMKREVSARPSLTALAIYLVATSALVVAFWPWLWSDPLGHFGQALASMSKFRFDYEVLYLGDYVRATQLPWHYLPVWISITTPPLYLLLFMAGAAAIGRRFIASGHRLWRSESELQDLVFLGIFLVPVVVAVGLHSVLYDGWRQLYFIYPAFLLVALRGWHALWSSTVAARILRPALAAATAISFVATAGWMWRVHPLQNVYFNVLAGTNLQARFEMDYWGLSTRQGLEKVLANDARASILVGETNRLALPGSIWLLRPQDRQRLRVRSDPTIPDYTFTNHHRFLHDPGNAAYMQHFELFHEVRVQDEVVLSIFKRKALPGG